MYTDVDGTPVFYANAAQLRVSVFDLQVRFYLQTAPAVPLTDDLPAVIIAMTPEHARALAQALTQTLTEYEANCGPIRTPLHAPEVRGREDR